MKNLIIENFLILKNPIYQGGKWLKNDCVLRLSLTEREVNKISIII